MYDNTFNGGYYPRRNIGDRIDYAKDLFSSAIKEDNLYKNIAQDARKMYDAYIAAGFDQDEAFELLIRHGTAVINQRKYY